MKLKIIFKWFTLGLAIILAIGIIAFNSFYMPFTVSGHSMEPNFHNNELVLGQRYHLSIFNIRTPIKTFEPQKDDIVIGHINEQVYGRNLHDNIIKRVIGTPGEKIDVNNNQVYINNKPLQEYYKKGLNYYNNSDGQINNQQVKPKYVIKEQMVKNNTLTGAPVSVQLNDHQLWLMGDNRNNSSDSRVFGAFDLNGNNKSKTELVAKIIKTNLPINIAYVEEEVIVLIAVNLGLFYYLDSSRDRKPERKEINTF